MNQYLSYHIAQDRHAEFLRQAKDNRRFDQRMKHSVGRIVGLPFSLLDRLTRYRRAVFNTVLTKQRANPTNLRMGSSG